LKVELLKVKVVALNSTHFTDLTAELSNLQQRSVSTFNRSSNDGKLGVIEGNTALNKKAVLNHTSTGSKRLR
jgi:hypothetical protein